jgi:hypothetical protein
MAEDSNILSGGFQESYSSANEHIAILRQQLENAQQSLQVNFDYQIPLSFC